VRQTIASASIREAAHYKPLVDRMLHCYNWLHHVPGTINWDAHRISTSIHRTGQTHSVKLCHGYSPEGKIAHCNNPSYPHQCPFCQQLFEDHQEHVLQCSHSSWSKWQDDLLKKLSDKCAALSNNPTLQSIFLNRISCWPKNWECNEGGIPTAYQALLKEQRKIGWYQVFLACMSLQWSISPSPNTYYPSTPQQWNSSTCGTNGAQIAMAKNHYIKQPETELSNI
jgi:hypothetical protein